ncbi:MAG: rhodanese-like domain-containing protein [Hylemonella sp.]|nr:rhodanese-like domain-containing protein [Hylemonella sp.]
MAARFFLNCLLVLAAFHGNAGAMTIEAHGNTVFASGPVGNDLLKFEAAFANKAIDTVVFVNSPGGDLWTGLRIGNLIAGKGYKTVIAGRCVSACSIMFMGGRERRFSDTFPPRLTYIGIHGAHRADTKTVDPALQPQIYAFYKHHIGERFNAQVISTALYEMDDSSSLLRVFDPVRSARTLPYHCKSGQTPRRLCTEFPGTDAVNTGIVTHAELVKVELPAALRPANKLLGQELREEIGDLPVHLAELGSRSCANDACKDTVLKFPGHPENRALATPLNGKGYGLAYNRDTPVQALAAAVYACNHVNKQAARLCEAQLVNDFETRELYRVADTLHKSALARLKVPAEKFFANEEFGGGFTTAKGLRTEKFMDMTPDSLDGIEILGTQQLAAALLSPEPPAIVDVLGAPDMVPSAHLLLYGGSAQPDLVKDADIAKRFEALLQLLAPDKERSLIFYCHSRNSWFSVNAAMRAKKLGYTKVGWYRGGLESWKAANLPTAPATVRAVVN